MSERIPVSGGAGFNGSCSVEAQIRTYVADNILFSTNGFPYADDVSFLDEGIVDSMNVLELILFAEQQFGVAVEDQDIVPDNFDSVVKLAAYIRRKAAPQRATAG